MKVDDFVTSATDATQTVQALTSTQATDAVNSHIVGSADKSGMTLNGNPLQEEMKNGTIASVEQKTVNGKVVDTKYHSTSGAVYDKDGNIVGNTKGGAAGKGSKAALKQSRMKKIAKDAAQAAYEMDGDVDEISGKKITDEATKLAKRTLSKGRKVGAEAGKQAGKEVVRKTSDKIGGLAEKRYQKKNPADAMRQMQSSLNQHRAQAAHKAAQKVGEKATAAIGNLVGAVGGMIGGILGILGTILAIIAPIVIVIAVIAAIIGGGQEQNLTLNEVENQVVSFFREKGLDDVHIAAIMANMYSESRMNPKKIEDKSGPENEKGHGICQWTGDRWNKLYAYCVRMGGASGVADWTNLNTQLDFFWNEDIYNKENWHSSYTIRDLHYSNPSPPVGTSVSGSKSGFESATTVEEATKQFCYGWERAGWPRIDERIAKAKEYYEAITSGEIGGNGAVCPVDANDIVKRAYSQLGKPYVWGAAGPNAFDCSGLVGYCITGQMGNHWCTTYTMKGWTRVSNPQPGDFCLNSGHTGVYIGNGQMIHAPRTGDVVKISAVHDGMWYVRYTG